MTTPLKRPILGITTGDPGGVGPEVSVKALHNSEIYTICRPLLIGDAEIMTNAVSFCNLDLKINICQEVTDGKFTHGTLDVMDMGNMPLAELQHKTVTAAQGKASFAYIDRAITLAMDSHFHENDTIQ